MTTKKGLLLVVSGPSGVGKGTVCKRLLEQSEGMQLSISATTRAMRKGEEEGKSYFFKSRDEFERMIEEGEFLEYVKLFNSNYYGTPRGPVVAELEKGRDVLLEIDYHGGLNVKKAFPDAVLVFIAPPTVEELRKRLIGRRTESEEMVEERLRTAHEEIAMMDRYDYVIVNDEVEQAAGALRKIVDAEKCRMDRNGWMIEKLKEELKK